jgi:hypothetical protein
MDPLTKGAGDAADIVRKPSAGTGRIGVYTALGALSGVIALPWVPDGLARRVRGALAQDLCSHFGVTLTPEARVVLAEPETPAMGGALGQAARFVALRWLKRFSPLGFLPPVRTGVTTYALAHLLDRYLSRHRAQRATRMDHDEAKTLRGLIDQTLVELLRTDLTVPPDRNRAAAPEDLRDGMTQVVDGVVIAVASVPDLLTRRLDAAFDVVMARAREGLGA